MSEVISQETIDAIKAEHPGHKLRQLSACGVTTIVRSPTEPEWERFQRDSLEPARRSKAMERLVRDCCVYPDKKGVDEFLARLPGLSITFGDQIAELGGITRDVEKKDL